MAAQRQAQQQQSLAPLVIAAGVAGAGYGTWMHWPGFVAIWAAFLVAAWMEPPAILTGKKDASGFPTPAHAGEVKRLARYQYWSDLRWRLLIPGSAWLPGWPILGAWLAAVFAAISVAHLITIEPLWRVANAASVFITITAVAASRRRTAAQGDSPGVRIDTLIGLFAKKWPIALAVFGLAVGVVGTVVVVNTWVTPGNVVLLPTFAASNGVCCALGLLALPWSNAALEHWRVVVAGRAEWDPRWQALKIDPAPFLVDRQQVGTAQVDIFDAAAGLPAMTYWLLGPKISPTIGAGARIAVLSVPDEGPEGPIPGTRHPLRFQVVAWANGEKPDFTDPSLDIETVELGAQCGMVWGMDPIGYARPILVSVEPLTTEESPVAAWQSTWAAPDGPSMVDIRAVAGDIADDLGTEVLVDHRSGLIYFGALFDDAAVWRSEDTPTGSRVAMEQLSTEDEWISRWQQVLKQGSNPPTIAHNTYAEKELKDGTVVHRVAWMTRVGIDPSEYRGLEPKLATSLNSAPFVAITGWPGSGDRPGERHPQAFVIYWADAPVPSSPERVSPSAAAQWVIAGHINQAFDAARLARPEVASARALTKPDTKNHIWRVDLRLYGGVTLADIRGQAARLRQALGASWFRVAAAEDGATLYIGALPATAELRSPRHDRLRLAALDWAQAWVDSGISGVGGLVPELLESSTLPHNEQVQRLTFRLPSGVDPSKIKASLSKLKNSTNNEFIEVRQSEDASCVDLLVSETNPLPTRVPLDFAAVDTADGLPFATGVEGEPVEFSFLDSPHALIAGLTGAGKSVLAQVILYGALVHGWECYVIDPVKGGADFAFAKDRSVAFAATPFEASGVVKAIYAEVVRRKNLNAEYGVGSYLDLPEEVRPPHIGVLIDEFTSLLGQAPVPPKTDDLTLNSEREAIEAENFARTEVGVFAGKLAREARSAGVTLLLATQKLNAKMLDAIPGASDLKEVALDTPLPVPISDKFPDGWATNAELEIGDLVFTVTGEEVPVIALTEVSTPESFRVTFADGQSVVAGAGHWWSVAADPTLSDPVDLDRTERLTTAQIRERFDENTWAVPLPEAFSSDLWIPKNAYFAGVAFAEGNEPRDCRWLRSVTEQRHSFLVGICHATHDPADSEFVYTTTSIDDARFVTSLARSLGLFVRGPEEVLGRHTVAFTLAETQRWNPIVSIEPVAPVPMRCIGVDHPSHLFVVADSVVTHNTNLARTLLGKASPGDRSSALRAPDDAPKLDGEVTKGRGLWEPVTAGAQIIQVWYASQEQIRDELVRRIPERPVSERLDLSGFVGPAEQATPPPSEPETTEPTQVIDLGEMSFDLDDLQLDEEPAPVEDETPTPLPVHTGLVQRANPASTTVMFVDVDGVLLPLSETPNGEFDDWQPVGLGRFSPEMIEKLGDVDAHRVWLTTWENEANEVLAPVFGWEGVEALTRKGIHLDDGETGWWKMAAARQWLQAHPEVTHVIWIDDDLAGETLDDDPLADAVFGLLIVEGIEPDRILLVDPDPQTGLTRSELDSIGQFARNVELDDDTTFVQSPTSTDRSEPEHSDPTVAPPDPSAESDPATAMDEAAKIAKVTVPDASWAPPAGTGEGQNYEEF